MASPSTMTVTVDRVSNSGNAIAREQRKGKEIHVPADADIGTTLEVRLVEESGYFRAQLVDSTDVVQPAGPSMSPDTSEIGQRILTREQNDTHSHSVSKSLTPESADEELRKLSSRKK